MNHLRDQNPTSNASPFVVRLWSPIFKFGGLPVFPLNFTRKIVLPRILSGQEADRERGERSIELAVLLFWAASIVAFLVLAASLRIFGYPSPSWLVVVVLVAMLGLLRVIETFLVQTNVLIFDAYSWAEGGVLHSVRGYYRLVILLIHNYVEAVFWFAVAYLAADVALASFDGSLHERPSRALWFSLFNMSSFGEALVRDIRLTTSLGYVMTAYQSVFGLFMAVLILARFIALLPVSWTEDAQEQSMLFSLKHRLDAPAPAPAPPHDH